MSEEKEEVLYQVRRALNEDAKFVAEVLYESENRLTVEEIEEALEENGYPLEQKQIRQALYGLNDEGFARSQRIRDKETGWIHFRWRLFPEKILTSND